MVLNALERIAFVPDAHDFILIGPGDDFEICRQGTGFDDQAVIARRLEGVRQSSVNTAAVMMDPRGFAVHDSIGPHHLRTKGMTDTLMAQADAKQGNPGGEPRDDFVRDSSLDRRAGPRRDDQVAGRRALDVFERDLIVANDFEIDARVDFAQPLYKVVCERVVVVDQENHDQKRAVLA